MENENPYTHIRDFEEVCMTFKEGATDMELLKLKAFPLTLKRQGHDLAQLYEVKNYYELGRYAGRIFEEILQHP